MDGYQWLADEHRDIAARLAQYHAAPDDGTAHDICQAIDRHVRVVEAAVTPIVRGELVEGDVLAEGAESDQASLQTLITRVYVAPPEQLEPLMREIEVGFEQHVRGEEREILTRLRDAGVDGAQLGDEVDRALARTA
jgi:hypothetical protein